MRHTRGNDLTGIPSAERLRAAMETYAPFFREQNGICGYGVAWREGYPAFVVKAESIGEVARLRGDLPESIEGLPLRIEVGEVPEFVQAETPIVASRRKWTSIRRLLSYLTSKHSWLAFERTNLARD